MYAFRMLNEVFYIIFILHQIFFEVTVQSTGGIIVKWSVKRV